MEEVLRRVLVVDPSRVVRSTLAKHLGGHFAVREEHDGESAWQTLVLDSTIVAVVASAQLPKLNGLDLLGRLRDNKLRRLSDIPFLLIVSGNESEAERLRARQRGVTDFITRGMSRQEILDAVGRLVNWEMATDFRNLGETPDDALPAGDAPPAEAGLLAVDALCGQLEELLVAPQSGTGMVGILAFGLDHHAELAARFGAGTVRAIASHVAHVLQAKTGAGDSVGSDAATHCLIVTPGTSLASCTAFARRVCRGLANSQVNIGGETFDLQVSAGIASLPDDAGLDADGLIRLAGARLARAQAAGGNRVIADDRVDTLPGFGADYFEELWRLYDPQAAAQHFGALGLHLMPLLRTLDREFRFGLPLAAIERSFALRASEECDRAERDRNAADDPI
ncbi:MAG TPA: response regulator [Azospira sp.]|nr:response regulator [Azospira sp.]